MVAAAGGAAVAGAVSAIMPSHVRESWYSAGRTPDQIDVVEINKQKKWFDLFYVPGQDRIMSGGK